MSQPLHFNRFMSPTPQVLYAAVKGEPINRMSLLWLQFIVGSSFFCTREYYTRTNKKQTNKKNKHQKKQTSKKTNIQKTNIKRDNKKTTTKKQQQKGKHNVSKERKHIICMNYHILLRRLHLLHVLQNKHVQRLP